MSLEGNTPTREMLLLCGQLQVLYDSKKALWTMEELYKKILGNSRLNQPIMSFERFRENMNWIIGHGLVSFHDDKLNLDDFAKNLLVHFFNEHRDILED